MRGEDSSHAPRTTFAEPVTSSLGAPLVVHQGRLEVVRQGERYVFDLARTYTQVEVRGRPGRPGWQVLFPRRGMAPFALDASMVDAEDFMRVLRFFRPELADR